MQGKGYCECGCGGRTSIAPQDSTRDGWKRGEPLRFISGHNSVRSGYVEEDRGHATPCWIWQGALMRSGYGQTGGRKRRRMAHVAFYEEHVGPVPDGLQLDHLCRVKACVNPGHLEPVTAAENVRRLPRTKLSVESVREIRRRVAAGETQTAVAVDYGVSRPCVSDIISNRNWKDVQ